jgi:hypothetical protein
MVSAAASPPASTMSSATAPSRSRISRLPRGLLLTAAELHVRADLGVVDAAERELRPDVLAALRIPVSPAAPAGADPGSAATEPGSAAGQ